MQDSRLPPDALFLVFEEDFRWWPDEKEPMKEALQMPSSSAAEPTAAAEQGKKGVGLRPKSSLRPPPRAKGQWWEVKPQGRTYEDLVAGVPQEVADCVRYSIKASRAGVGELMWMGYNALGKRKSIISTGTQFLMLTKKGGAVMLDAMQKDELERGPIDMTIKAWLLKHEHEFQRTIGFSYLYPPMGGFKAHESEISIEGPQKKPKFQENFWTKPTACIGSRRSDDPRNRSKYMCQLTEKGSADYIVDVDVEKEIDDLIWKTFSLVEEASAEEEETAQLSLPPVAPPVSQSSSSSWWNSWQGWGHSWWEGETWSQWQTGEDAAQGQWEAAKEAEVAADESTRRSRRMRRKRIWQESYRIYVQDRDEALLYCCPCMYSV